MERNTTAYQLNILRDTQMVQRRLLEKQFPYIDWARMPFSSYGDFFRLRGIIDDCGAVWTNAYGRSNTEPDGQRNFLEDYSGNGRDIELFNFGYSKQSGFNGYVQDFRVWNVKPFADLTCSVSENSVYVLNNMGSGGWCLGCSISSYTNKEWKCYVETDGYPYISFVNTNELTNIKRVLLTNGLNTIPITEESGWNIAYIDISPGKSITLTQIAPYQGAIVGDGVDDNGQCVKDFSLPDDYTVVAMRETLVNSGTLIGKNESQGNPVKPGAFCFEIGKPEGVSLESYYDVSTGAGTTTIASMPKLFSYQTKSSYNGQELNVGSGTDTDACRLNIFRSGENTTYFKSAALFSFGIFTRTLTEEELRIVENCMYAEWIAMTGKLEDIEYYDILDARFRSNDEDADKRNKWVGRLGKLHMALNNYAYSEMSGWNGYLQTWSINGSRAEKVNEFRINILKIDSSVQLYYNTSYQEEVSLRLKVKGVKSGWRFSVSEARGGLVSREIAFFNGDGNQHALNVKSQVQNQDTNQVAIFLYASGETVDLSDDPVAIELIPDYGGALVSDGVDDNAVSDETIDEKIGGFVCHAGYVTHAGYVFSSGPYANNESIFYCAGALSNQYIYGNPNTSHRGNDPLIIAFSRTPLVPNSKLSIGRPFNEEIDFGNTYFYQLRLIKTQPTETQLEAIKWQCRKEHDDYLIHMGWKEVE